MAKFGVSNKANRDSWIRAKLAGIPSGDRILDAGAGECPYRESCRHLEYVSQDFGSYAPSSSEPGIQPVDFDSSGVDIKSDVTNIPVADASFDAVLCTEVIEHVPQPWLVIKEFGRIIRPGGTLLLTAPFCSLTHQAPYHFATGYSKFFYLDVLEKHDFEVVSLDPNGNYFSYIAQELHRLNGVASEYASEACAQGRIQLYLRNFAINRLIAWLKQLSRVDEGSSELLCYGWHVMAKRR